MKIINKLFGFLSVFVLAIVFAAVTFASIRGPATDGNDQQSGAIEAESTQYVIATNPTISPPTEIVAGVMNTVNTSAAAQGVAQAMNNLPENMQTTFTTSRQEVSGITRAELAASNDTNGSTANVSISAAEYG